MPRCLENSWTARRPASKKPVFFSFQNAGQARLSPSLSRGTLPLCQRISRLPWHCSAPAVAYVTSGTDLAPGPVAKAQASLLSAKNDAAFLPLILPPEQCIV